tara:strand:- start:509 stop:703 length:195 start_codon:yes stop_codon:yes gene_type:complete
LVVEEVVVLIRTQLDLVVEVLVPLELERHQLIILDRETQQLQAFKLAQVVPVVTLQDHPHQTQV